MFILKKLILIRNRLHTFINRDIYAETVTKQFTCNIRHFVLPQTCMIAGGRVSGFFGRILYFASISADMNSTPIQFTSEFVFKIPRNATKPGCLCLGFTHLHVNDKTTANTKMTSPEKYSLV